MTRVYRNTIDIDRLCGREKDVHQPLPLGLDEAKGILVEEDRRILPAYQKMPHPLVSIAHAAGHIEDWQFDAALNECDVFASESEKHTLQRLVNGLLCTDTNVYLAGMWMAQDLQSAAPAALAIEGGGWHFYFKPKDFCLGFSGRTLRDSKGNEYAEELYLHTTPEMVLRGIDGIHAKRIGIHTGEGVRILERGKTQTEFSGKYRERSNDLKIDLSKLPIPEGWEVVPHSLEKQLGEYEGNVFVFETKFSDWRDLLTYVNATTNNVVWKALQLYQHCWSRDPNGGSTGNNFFHVSYNFPSNHWVMLLHNANVALGSTGREVRIKDNYFPDGGEWPSNWQRQYVGLKLSRAHLLAAIFDLSDAVKRVALDRSSGIDTGYQVFFDRRDPSITPEHPVTIYGERCSEDRMREIQTTQREFL